MCHNQECGADIVGQVRQTAGHGADVVGQARSQSQEYTFDKVKKQTQGRYQDNRTEYLPKDMMQCSQHCNMKSQ